MKNKGLSLLLSILFIIPCMLILSACGNTEPPKTKYSITISQIENGEIATNKTSAYAGDNITVTVNACAGYELEANSLRYNGIAISNYSFTMPDEDVVITANFVVETFEINYNVDEFTTHANPTSVTADDIINLADPIKSGYDFDGWYYDASFNNEVQGTISNLNNDLNLYPKFNQLFIVQNGSYVIGLTDYAKQKTKLIFPSIIDGVEISWVSIKDVCNNLEEIIIEEGITAIPEEDAFAGCNNLKKITLPITLRPITLPDSFFTGCSSLKTIIVENQNKEEDGLYAENNVLYFKRSGSKFDPSQGGAVSYTDIYMLCYPSGLTNETYTVPEGVTYLYGFGNAKFKNLEISSTVEKISNISNCTQIENITVNANNKHIKVQDYCLLCRETNNINNIDVLKLYYGNSATLIVPTICDEIEETALKNSNLTSIICGVSPSDIDVKIFEHLPNLKFFSKREKPVPSSWYQEDLYRDVLNCDNIYWYLETEPTEDGQFWHYANDGTTPVIW